MFTAGYTPGMKTAVSVPDDIFREADALARRSARSRSEVYSAALRDYLARHDPEQVTRALDDVVSRIGGAEGEEEFLAAAGRRLLEQSEW